MRTSSSKMSIRSPRTLLMACWLFCLWGAPEVQANSCRFNRAKWTNPNQGPKVTQPNRSDPTKVTVSWDRMLTNPECIYSCTINVWRKDIDSKFTNTRKVEVQQLLSTSFVVDNIDPCTDLVFMLEFSDSEGFSLTKVKSGETTFKTDSEPSLLSRDGSKVRVTYLYKNATSSHDLKTAIIQLDKDRYIKYPNCVAWIEVSGRVETYTPSSPSKPVYDGRPTFPSTSYSLRRTKRTIGQLPRTSSTSSTSSSSSSSYSSSTSQTTTPGSRSSEYPALTDINEKVFPPFRGLNGVAELSVTVQPCKTYRFTLDVKQDNRRSLGKIENVVLPPLAHMEGMKLPPIQSVLRLKETLTTIKIDMEPGSPVPPSCLIPYIDAVDTRMKVLQDLHLSTGGSRTSNHGIGDSSPACSRTPSPTSPGGTLPNRSGIHDLSPVSSDPKFQKLRDAGCTCWNSTTINVTSTDKTVLTKHPEVLGDYEFDGQLKDGKPMFTKRNGTGTEYIYWNNKTREWWITDTLTSTKPTLKTKAEKDLICVSNNVAGKKLQFWERQSSFVGWSDDDSLNVKCVPSKSILGGGGFVGGSTGGTTLSEEEAKKQLKQHGCVCQTSSQLNLSSTDSRTMKEHKDEMGIYTFEGQWYENHPYFTKRSSSTRDIYYLYWDKEDQTWFIGQQLGQKLPLMRMESNVGTKCPGDPTLKFWQRKNVFGSWGTDETMTLKCHGNLLNTLSGSSLIGGVSDDSKKKELLRQAGCKCHKSLHVNITSTDSRTIRKHGDELGEYTFEGKIHQGKPYYTKNPRVLSGKKYYIFWEPDSRTWWLGDQLGTRSPSMKMDDDTDLLCPADPPTQKSKAWMRKNVLGIWSDDDSTKVQCMMH